MKDRYELLEWVHDGLSRQMPEEKAFIRACEMVSDIVERDIHDNALLELGICPACFSSGWLIEADTNVEVDIRCLNCGEGYILLC